MSSAGDLGIPRDYVVPDVNGIDPARPGVPAQARPKKVYPTTKCIYFPDATVLEELQVLLMQYPRTSLSAVISQLIPEVVRAIKELSPEERCLKLEVKLYL